MTTNTGVTYVAFSASVDATTIDPTKFRDVDAGTTGSGPVVQVNATTVYFPLLSSGQTDAWATDPGFAPFSVPASGTADTGIFVVSSVLVSGAPSTSHTVGVGMTQMIAGHTFDPSKVKVDGVAATGSGANNAFTRNFFNVAWPTPLAGHVVEVEPGAISGSPLTPLVTLV